MARRFLIWFPSRRISFHRTQLKEARGDSCQAHQTDASQRPKATPPAPKPSCRRSQAGPRFESRFAANRTAAGNGSTHEFKIHVEEAFDPTPVIGQMTKVTHCCLRPEKKSGNITVASSATTPRPRCRQPKSRPGREDVRRWRCGPFGRRGQNWPPPGARPRWDSSWRRASWREIRARVTSATGW